VADWMERAKQQFQKSAKHTTDVTDERTLTSVMAVPQKAEPEYTDSNVSNGSTTDVDYQGLEPDSFIEFADESRVIDPDLFIDAACHGLPIDREWVCRIVVCDEDIEDIRQVIGVLVLIIIIQPSSNRGGPEKSDTWISG